MQANVSPADESHHRLSRSRPYACLRHGPQRRDGGIDGPRGRLFQGQGRLDAHVLGKRRNSTAATASSARKCRWARGWPSPTSIKNNGGVCLTYMGDGAANQGQVYESFNMAELWKLPVVYIIENNQYADGNSASNARARKPISTSAAHRSTCRARSGRHGRPRPCLPPGAKPSNGAGQGNGPIILEMKTYRYRGHSMSDPAKYRTREEVQNMREKRDPIEHLVLEDASSAAASPPKTS